MACSIWESWGTLSATLQQSHRDLITAQKEVQHDAQELVQVTTGLRKPTFSTPSF